MNASSATLYEPLAPNHIRILTLLPGVLPAPITCDLENIPIEHIAQCQALSYHWGPRTLRPITVNSRVVQITSSLEKALSFLRHPTQPRRLWVDAVCINQDDTEEKNTAIPQMRQIYALAGRVLIWIGDYGTLGPGDVENAFKCAKQLAESARRGLIGGSDDRSCWNEFGQSMVWTMHDDYLHPLRILLERPWFSRVWVVQEAVLGRIESTALLCGHRSISFSLILDATRVLARSSDDTRFYRFRGAQTIQSIMERRIRNRTAIQNLGIHEELPIYLQFMAPFQCSDPRDRCYGIHGLLQSDTLPPGLEPHYEWPVSAVFRMYASFLLKEGRMFNILAARSWRNMTEDWPSWVPDWEQHCCLHFGLGDNAHLRFLHDNTKIEVDCLFLSTIEATTDHGFVEAEEDPAPCPAASDFTPVVMV